jgi:hypothetical protein
MSAGLTPDAVLAGGITLSLFFGAALWKLATMLAEIRAQIRNNGGSSIKDHVERIDKKLDRIETTTAEAATVAGLAISRAERAVDMVEQASHVATAERAKLAEQSAQNRSEIARTQGAVESLERTLALTVVTAKLPPRTPQPRKRAT